MKKIILIIFSIFIAMTSEVRAQDSRMVQFVGVDISGSFQDSKYFDDSLDFLAHYLFFHLNGLDGLEKPKYLFVGPIGGAKAHDVKSFFPIENFENRSIAEILVRLKEIFPKKVQNPYTDFNSFIDQISETIKNRKMVLRPISILMISDGVPDAPSKEKKNPYRGVKLKDLEKLSRNITLSLLFTSPNVGSRWQKEVPRKRVKMWTQDAEVMAGWKDSKIYDPAKPPDEQDRFINWLKNNVDFGVRAPRVD